MAIMGTMSTRRINLVKYFCDGCGIEITKNNACCGGGLHCPDSRLGGDVTTKNGVTLSIEIMTSLDGVANKGSFCKKCVVDAINELAAPKRSGQKLRLLRD